MDTHLPPHLQEIIRRKVATGDYGSEAEVLEEALLLLDRRDASEADALAALKRDIQAGLASGRVGELDFDSIIRDAEGT